MMTTRAHRHTFTTNRQRGNAGSPTLNHTTITRAGPSASLGDDPSSHSLWRPPSPPSLTHLSHHLHTNRLYTRYYKDYTHPIWEFWQYFEDADSLGCNHSNHGQEPKVVFSSSWVPFISYYPVLTYAPYLTAVQVGSLISLLSHFCRDVMQVNHPAVSHMTHSCPGKRNVIIKESKCRVAYCIWHVFLLWDHFI